ncbi:22433_t:CDS:2, partial [Racocetra persica]
ISNVNALVSGPMNELECCLDPMRIPLAEDNADLLNGASERLFSIAGNQITAKRTQQLDSSLVAKIMFSEQNYDAFETV